MSDDQQIYLYQTGKDIIEVVLTGRTAQKQQKRKKIILHEISSTDEDVGFRTWVKLDQLFVLEEE